MLTISKVFSYYSNLVPHYMCRLTMFIKRSELNFKFSRLHSITDIDDIFTHLWSVQKSTTYLNGTRKLTPGFSSNHGKDMDAIEGVTRFLPYIASNLRNTSFSSELLGELNEYIRSVILAGTSEGKYKWGHLYNKSQILCEAADVALTIWLSKEKIWETLEHSEKQQVLNWLTEVINKEFVQNNWLLFKVVICLVLRDLGCKTPLPDEEFNIIKSFYISDGYFTDGLDGAIDYYNNWGFIYSLFWISQIDPGFHAEFIREVIEKNAHSYTCTLNSEGIPPVYGRSVSYRIALACPLLSHAYISGDKLNVSSAFNVLISNINYFCDKGAIDKDGVTQGLFHADEKHVDEYSGPNSPMWSLRSLIIANYMREKNKHIDCNDEQLSNLQCKKVALANGKIICERDILSKQTSLEVNQSNRSYYKLSFLKKVLKTVVYLRVPRVTTHREMVERKLTSENYFYRSDSRK